MLFAIPELDNLTPETRAAVESITATAAAAFAARHTPVGLIARPMLLAYHNTTQSIATATWTAVNFNAEENWTAVPTVQAVPGLHSLSVRPDRFVVPRNRAGLVKVSGRITFAANATGSRGVSLASDDVIVRILDFRSPATTIGVSVVPFAVEYLAAGGEALGIQVYQNSGGALAIGNTAREFQNEVQIEFA